MFVSASRVALRYLIAEGPPEHWDEFIKAKYQGGKKKVTNTNPKTKSRYPQVSMQTLFNSDEAFKKKVMEEYEEWVGEKDKKKVQPKHDILADEQEIDAFYEEHKDLFSSKQFQLGGVEKSGVKRPNFLLPGLKQGDVETELRDTAYGVGKAYQEAFPDLYRQAGDFVSIWTQSSNSSLAQYVMDVLKGEESGDGVLDKALKHQYLFTQAWFKHHGITHVTLYRGVKRQIADSVSVGSEVNLQTRAISSWSIDPSIAGVFGSKSSDGAILESRVPVNRIFMTPLTRPDLGGRNSPSWDRENEFIVTGLDGYVTSKVLHRGHMTRSP